MGAESIAPISRRAPETGKARTAWDCFEPPWEGDILFRKGSGCEARLGVTVFAKDREIFRGPIDEAVSKVVFPGGAGLRAGNVDEIHRGRLTTSRQFGNNPVGRLSL